MSGMLCVVVYSFFVVVLGVRASLQTNDSKSSCDCVDCFLIGEYLVDVVLRGNDKLGGTDPSGVSSFDFAHEGIDVAPNLEIVSQLLGMLRGDVVQYNDGLVRVCVPPL